MSAAPYIAATDPRVPAVTRALALWGVLGTKGEPAEAIAANLIQLYDAYDGESVWSADDAAWYAVCVEQSVTLRKHCEDGDRRHGVSREIRHQLRRLRLRTQVETCGECKAWPTKSGLCEEHTCEALTLDEQEAGMRKKRRAAA